MPVFSWSARVAASIVTLAACSSGGDGGTDPTGSFTIGLNPATLSVEQGSSGQVTVTLTRIDGFAGTVTFSVEGVPQGVTGTVTGGGAGTVTTGTVTIQVGAAVTPGSYPLTLRATASGLTDRTAGLALTVTQAGGFSIATTLPGLTVVQGGTGTGTVTLTRTGSFAGPVALSVAGVPAGVTATFAPATIGAGATTADLNVTVGAAVAAGAYPLVITGTATGLPNATANFTLTVNQGAGSFTLAAAPPVLGIAQGGSGQTTVTVTRAGGFTGAVTLALTTTSAGIGATFQPAVIPAGSTTAQVTITVPPVAGAPGAAGGDVQPTPLGDYQLVITGTAQGAPNATVNLVISVTPAAGGSFTMLLAPAAGTVQAGNSIQSTLTVTRTAPFVGGVSFTVSGLPASATMLFAPVAIAAGGTTTQATIFTSPATPAGTYPITVTGIGDGVNVPNAVTGYTLTVTAAPPPAGTANWRFCNPAFAPIWFAHRDGVADEPWTVIPVGANTTYSFTPTGNGTVAWVEPDGDGGFLTRILVSSMAGLISLGDANCDATPATKTVTGSVTGLGAADQSLVSLGTSAAAATFAQPNFTIRRVPPGNRTLVAARSAFNFGTLTFAVDRIVIRRNQNFPDGGVIPVINFGTEGFAPVFHSLTVGNLLGWVAGATTSYFTDGGGSAGVFANGVPSAGALAFPAVPSGQQILGDFHYVTATAQPGLMDATQFRSVGRFFSAGAPQSLTLGAILAAPTVSALGGAGYARLQVTGGVQSDYGRLLQFSYGQTGRQVIMLVTGSPFATGGGSSYTVVVPNFAGLAGFLPSWLPATGVSTSWQLMVQGWDGNGVLGGLPEEGERVLTASTGGQIVP